MFTRTLLLLFKATCSCLLCLRISKTQREDVPFCRTGFQISFCCWKHIAVDSEFFVLSTLEKSHQISLSDPCSATFDLGWIKLPKIKSDGLCFRRMFWKSSLYMSTSSRFSIPRIHTEFFVIVKPLVDARMRDSRRLLSEVFETKADYNFSLIASREEKNTWNIVKITCSCGNYNIFTFFSCCLPETRTKDHRNGRLFSNSKQNIYVWNLKLQYYREEHKSYLQGVFELFTWRFG